MIPDDTDKLRLALRRRAMDLLARREHTRHELGNKLSVAFQKAEQDTQIVASLIPEVLDKLEQDKLLSDSRFTEAYVNGRLNRGYGPQYIRHGLRQKRVDGELSDNSLEQLDQQKWVEQLVILLRRRVNDEGLPQRGSKEYLKLQRFALSRGFTAAQWRDAEKLFRSP